jgi:hypothetical protein
MTARTTPYPQARDRALFQWAQAMGRRMRNRR